MKQNKILTVVTLCLLLFFVNAQTSFHPSLSPVPFDLLEDLCSQKVFENCDVLDTKPFSGSNVFVDGYVLSGILLGDFTTSIYQEALLAIDREGSEYDTAYALLQKRESSWIAVDFEKVNDALLYGNDELLRGQFPMLFEGGSRDIVATFQGSLIANEMTGEPFTIRRADFELNHVEVTALFEMPRMSNWWDCNRRYIPDGEAFATSYMGYNQEDVNQDGYLDISIDVDVRYWNNIIARKFFVDEEAKTWQECEEAFQALPVETEQVVFYFDGQDFKKGENVDWLLNLYNPSDNK